MMRKEGGSRRGPRVLLRLRFGLRLGLRRRFLLGLVGCLLAQLGRPPLLILQRRLLALCDLGGEGLRPLRALRPL
eukprot:5184739-Pyramimonas_sp.AAC.1